MTIQTDVVIAGGGAAGLMCAIEAAKRGRRVLVLERNAAPGRKILISGGGRCNFTNLDTRAEHFLSRNPHFAKSALARYTPRDFVALVERHGIAYHEKTLGQLFCDGSAREIVAMLEAECDRAGVRIETAVGIQGCSTQPSASARFELETTVGQVRCESLVIATGGLSIPKIGATGFGYDLAGQFGLNVIPCRPALTPIIFSKEDREEYSDLAGVSAEARVSAGGAEFREKFLFTHRGLSGPAILQASSYWSPGAEITIDLLPAVDLAAHLRERRAAGDGAEPRTLSSRFLPKRLADRWFESRGPLKPAAMLSDAEIDAVSAAIHNWRIRPAGTEGYDKAEVTGGGVDTAELSSKTLEANKVAGLYFIGEVVDVTGHLGGFNFQWAWASGHAAGQYA